jgi:hypothetical protein
MSSQFKAICRFCRDWLQSLLDFECKLEYGTLYYTQHGIIWCLHIYTWKEGNPMKLQTWPHPSLFSLSVCLLWLLLLCVYSYWQGTTQYITWCRAMHKEPRIQCPCGEKKRRKTHPAPVTEFPLLKKVERRKETRFLTNAISPRQLKRRKWKRRRNSRKKEETKR